MNADPNARVEIPGLRTKTEGNQREHWRKTQKRASTQREATALACAAWLRYRGKVRLVRITRTAPGAGLDPQNLMSALKHVIDGVADVVSPIRHVDRMGVERGDDSPRAGIEWAASQEPGPHGIRIEVWA